MWVRLPPSAPPPPNDEVFPAHPTFGATGTTFLMTMRCRSRWARATFRRSSPRHGVAGARPRCDHKANPKTIHARSGMRRPPLKWPVRMVRSSVPGTVKARSQAPRRGTTLARSVAMPITGRPGISSNTAGTSSATKTQSPQPSHRSANTLDARRTIPTRLT